MKTTIETETKTKINTDFINLSEVARKIGISPEYVWMLVHGKRKNKKRLKQIDSVIKNTLEAA